MAENVDALNFVYLDENDAVLATPVANLAAIRSIQITVVARSDKRDREYTDTAVYQNQNPDGPDVILSAQNDNFRRRLFTAQIKCRNLWDTL